MCHFFLFSSVSSYLFMSGINLFFNLVSPATSYINIMSSTTNNDDTHKFCDEGGGGSSSKGMFTSCEQNKNVGSSDSISNTSSSNNIDIDAIAEGIAKIEVSDDTKTNINLSACASCGKEGSDSDMNTCNKCNMVQYCNAVCKKKHRSKHKKKCERRVAELHDEKLFKQPPPRDECPICFLILPLKWKREEGIMHAVERLFVVDVFMQIKD